MPATRPLIALVCFLLSIGFAASPFLVTDFAGFDPDQFPVPQDNPPVQPAGYAFAIWGLIYLWLILGLGWGLLKARQDGQWHDMRKPLSVSLAVGTLWLAVAVASPIWASSSGANASGRAEPSSHSPSITALQAIASRRS